MLRIGQYFSEDMEKSLHVGVFLTQECRSEAVSDTIPWATDLNYNAP